MKRIRVGRNRIIVDTKYVEAENAWIMFSTDTAKTRLTNLLRMMVSSKWISPNSVHSRPTPQKTDQWIEHSVHVWSRAMSLPPWQLLGLRNGVDSLEFVQIVGSDHARQSWAPSIHETDALLVSVLYDTSIIPSSTVRIDRIESTRLRCSQLHSTLFYFTLLSFQSISITYISTNGLMLGSTNDWKSAKNDGMIGLDGLDWK